MKLGCGFSILIFLFILQVCTAVKCPYGSVTILRGDATQDSVFAKGLINCKTTCAAYICPNGFSGSGCPEDFLADCPNEKSAIDFIKRKNLNNMEFNGYGVTYVSGCDNDADVVKCLTAKFTKVQTHGMDGAGNGRHVVRGPTVVGGPVYWDASKDGFRRK